MKTYRIIAACDPYNARMHYNGQPVVKKDGATPTQWVMASGLTSEEAKDKLWEYAHDDMGRHSDLCWEDADSIDYIAGQLAEDAEISIEEAIKSFNWFKGEGIYYNESHEPMYLKGGDAYSYDTMTYKIEEE